MVRTKIQASQLVNRLQDHAFGKIEMSDAQRDSAKFLIGYAISRPAQDVAVEHDGKLVISWAE